MNNIPHISIHFLLNAKSNAPRVKNSNIQTHSDAHAQIALFVLPQNFIQFVNNFLKYYTI